MSSVSDGGSMPQDHHDRTEPGPARRPRDAGLDAASRARIGRGLRLHDAELLALPTPERLRAPIDARAARSDPEVPR